jgi:hypothetical protein
MSMRPRHAQFGQCLLWMAALAMITSVAVGGQVATLCISNSGGVGITPPSEACVGCPISTCPGKPSLPVEPADLQPLDDDDCCYDVPVPFEPSVCIMPREAGATDTLISPSPLVFIVPVEAMLAAPRAAGPSTEPTPHHLRHMLICLHSVLLLL